MAELGALSLRIETVGDKQALTALDAIDVKAKGVSGTEQKLTASQKALNREIAEGTRLFALQGRTIDATSNIAVTELRASAAAQKQWLQQIGASTIQQEQFNRTVQQFEQRIGVFGGSITNAQGRVNAFGRSGLNAFNALAFGMSQMAATGTMSFRSLATSMTSVLAFFGPQGAIAAGIIATGLVMVDFFTRTRKQIEETAKKAKEEVDGLVEAFRQRDAVQVIEDGLKGINAQLKTNRENRAAIFDIQARTDAAGFTHEIDQKKLAEIDAERAKLLTSEVELTLRLGEAKAKNAKTDEEAEQKRLARIAAQIANLETLEKLQKLTATDMVAVVKLEGQLRAETQRTNITLEERARLLKQIETLEGLRIRKVPAPSVQPLTPATPQAATTLGALGPLSLPPPKINVADPMILALEKELLALANDKSQGPSLRAAAQKALDSISGQMSPLTFKQKVELDLLLDTAASVDAAFANFLPDISSVLIDALGSVFSGDKVSDVILKGLGGIFQQMGAALISYGLIMSGLLPALLNPFTSGPAAIAAGAALVVLGSALKGAASGKGGGGGAGGGRGGGSGSGGGGLDTIRSFVTGSDSRRGLGEAPEGLRGTIGDLRRSTFGADTIGALSPRSSLGSLASASAPVNPWAGVTILGIETPSGSALIARTTNNYNRDRGGG